jgi:hypothetical protein
MLSNRGLRSVGRWLRVLPLGAALLSLVACDRAPDPAATPQPVASIQEIMQALVDPSADTLWEAVSSETTAAGTVDHHPQNDAEWLALRHHAIRLAEGANLLAQPGRVVSHAGKQLEDSHVEGILVPAQIQKLIDADRPAFAQHANALQQATLDLLAAIDQRKLDGYTAAGARIDHACEACHLRYWYPNDKRPPELRPAASR